MSDLINRCGTKMADVMNSERIHFIKESIRSLSGCGMCAIAIVLITLLLHETKGQIQKGFAAFVNC